LLHTKLTVTIEAAPAGEVFTALGQATGVPILGRYSDDAFGHGIEPEIPISLSLQNRDALTVLELALEQCELFQPCTWQIRKGFVEVGTKERLSAPAAAETRLYSLTDLALQPPYFEGPKPSLQGSIRPGMLGQPGGPAGQRAEPAVTFRGIETPTYFARHEYACSALTVPTGKVFDAYGGKVARKTPDRLVEEIVRGIVEIVEPGNWDYGQFDDQADVEDDRSDGDRRLGGGRRHQPPGSNKIARLRVRGNELIIRAPDFIHRQIDGYPRPIPPERLSESGRSERSTRASSKGITVVVEEIGR
jgi:hypothetical protein